VLSDRMSCLRAGIVANVVVPHPDYVRLAKHFGFRPDFCEAADPESKGVVEALVGYVQADLIVPALGAETWPDLTAANAAARAWCHEVNGSMHSEIVAVPAERLQKERDLLRPLPSLRPPLHAGALRKVDRLGTVRFGSARYAVPAPLVGQQVEIVAQEGVVVISQGRQEIIRHALVAPGEVAFGALAGEMGRRAARGVRPRGASEVAFLSLGPIAEQFLRAAAAAGTQRLASELAAIVELEPAWGREVLVAALDRAVRFRRFRAADVRAILAAGRGVPTPVPAGAALPLELPSVPTRALSAYALEAWP
jgi:Mu transposase-like protein